MFNTCGKLCIGKNDEHILSEKKINQVKELALVTMLPSEFTASCFCPRDAPPDFDETASPQ
jgi:hypothetical protein